MEQKFDNKAVTDNRVIRIGVEEDCDKSIRCRSGLLIGRGPFEPAKVTVLSNEKIKINDELMPTVGVYCTMVCADYQPPRLLSASESEEILSKTKLVYADCN